MSKLQFEAVENYDGSVALQWSDAETGAATNVLKLTVGEWRDLARTADYGLFAAKNRREPRQRQHTRAALIEQKISPINIVRDAIIPRTRRLVRKADVQ